MSNILPLTAALGGGLLAGASLVYLPRNRFIAAYQSHAWIQRGSLILEWLPAILLAIGGSIFDLWKRDTLQNADATTYAAYFFAAGSIAFTATFKWFLSSAKDQQAQSIKDITSALTKSQETCRQKERQRDFLLQVQAQTAEIVKAKLARIAAARDAAATSRNLKELVTALAPRDQLNLLMQALHQHFQKSIEASYKIRAGMYVRSDEDSQVLIAVAAWDGRHADCFSNRHTRYMRLDNPGGAQSLVVKCYHSTTPLLRVEDCIAAEKEDPPRFTFFSPEQRGKILSMVAYRYNLQHTSIPSAIILTLDTNQPRFFSDEREFECRILLQEIGQRIELELTSLELIKNLQDKQQEPPSS